MRAHRRLADALPFVRPVDDLRRRKHLAAMEATAPLTREDFRPVAAGVAMRTDDVGRWHCCIMAAQDHFR